MDKYFSKWEKIIMTLLPIYNAHLKNIFKLKKYFVAFRFRLYKNSLPPDYSKKAEKFIEKQKYDKALKIFNKAIKENQFDYNLFEKRSKINGLLGNNEGEMDDLQESKRLQNEVLSIVDAVAIGITRTVQTRGYVVAPASGRR